MPDIIVQKILLIPVLLISLSVHELSHGLAAYAMGDKTAKRMGRLSLNPLRHIDWLGFLMLIIAGWGWAKPVGVDPRNFRNPKQGMALTALAGPVSNVVLAFVSCVIFLIAGRYTNNVYVFTILKMFVWYNSILAMFNLIPIPPLDGAKVFGALLPSSLYFRIMQYERFGFIVLLILVYTNSLNRILDTGVNNLVNKISDLAAALLNLFNGMGA